MIHEYQQVQSSHANDGREDEILVEDAIKYNTHFVETRDAEALEDNMCKLLIIAADKTKSKARQRPNIL